ncbi:hypothetical protein ETAA8_13330 [Anatilimnocola aggregata]|uniref:Uncharacterized protein n=2 Tax=Anatilimnocola aggregata TaxID=2528021 RepID=A0A517Y7P9_9BACT|nr:hypothetical protein ETAA8_13330 [Anatilimnocola aggregata]
MLLADDSADRQRTLRRHLMVRLAGQVAEMAFTIQQFRATGHQVHWSRWRLRWIRNLFLRSEVDTDFTYAALFAWGICRDASELRRTFDQLWRDTEGLLRRPAYWSQIELLSAALSVRPVMTGEEAFAVIRPLAP